MDTTTAFVAEPVVDFYTKGYWPVLIVFGGLLFALLGAIPESAKSKFWGTVGMMIRRYWSIWSTIWLIVVSLSIPAAKYPVWIGLGVGWVFWFGWKASRILGRPTTQLEQPKGEWVTVDNAVRYIRELLLNLGGEFETDYEIRQRFAKAIQVGILKGQHSVFQSGPWERITADTANKILAVDKRQPKGTTFHVYGYVRFWSLGLYEVARLIQQGDSSDQNSG